MFHVIPRAEWTPFLGGFSRAHEGWLVSVDVFGPGEEGATEAVEQPLVGVIADRAGDEPSIAIVVGREPDQELTHSVHGVESVRLNRTEDGAEKALEILDREGKITVVRFRSAMRPEQVDGVLPHR